MEVKYVHWISFAVTETYEMMKNTLNHLPTPRWENYCEQFDGSFRSLWTTNVCTCTFEQETQLRPQCIYSSSCLDIFNSFQL